MVMCWISLIAFADSLNRGAIHSLFFKTSTSDKDVLFFRTKDGKYENYDDDLSAMFPTEITGQPFIFRSDEFFVFIYYQDVTQVWMVIVWHYATGTCKKVKFSSLFPAANRDWDEWNIYLIQGISQGHLYCHVYIPQGATENKVMSDPLITTVDLRSICFGSSFVINPIHASVNGMSLKFRKALWRLPSAVCNDSVLYYLNRGKPPWEPEWTVKSFIVKNDKLEYYGYTIKEEGGDCVGGANVDPNKMFIISNHLIITFLDRYGRSYFGPKYPSTTICAKVYSLKGVDSDHVIDKFEHVFDLQSFGNGISVVTICHDEGFGTTGQFNVSISLHIPKHPNFENVCRVCNVSFSFN